jgi:hypothetical protein
MIHSSQPDPTQDPVRLALRTISETRRIVEEVVTSSESFNYPKAKEGLKELQRMIRELGPGGGTPSRRSVSKPGIGPREGAAFSGGSGFVSRLFLGVKQHPVVNHHHQVVLSVAG